MPRANVKHCKKTKNFSGAYERRTEDTALERICCLFNTSRDKVINTRDFAIELLSSRKQYVAKYRDICKYKSALCNGNRW